MARGSWVGVVGVFGASIVMFWTAAGELARQPRRSRCTPGFGLVLILIAAVALGACAVVSGVRIHARCGSADRLRVTVSPCVSTSTPPFVGLLSGRRTRGPLVRDVLDQLHDRRRRQHGRPAERAGGDETISERLRVLDRVELHPSEHLVRVVNLRSMRWPFAACFRPTGSESNNDLNSSKSSTLR